MSWFASLFTDTAAVAHIILVYALVIAAGTLFGRIRIAGVSLGVTFVLFAGLAAGHFGLSVPPAVLTFMRDFGLTLFVFFIGLQVGPSFFSSFKSGGLLLNLLTVLLVVLGIGVTIALYFFFSGSVSLPQMLGVHYGAVTNTPGLGATQEALDVLHYTGENIAVAYACAYPLGVVGTIACAIILRYAFRIDLAEEDKHWEDEEKAHNHEPIFFHVEVTNAAIDGRTISQIREFISRPFICSRILSGGRVSSPTSETVTKLGDVLRIVAAPENRLPIAAFFGSEREGVDLATEKSPVATRTILITRSKINGMTVKDLALSQFEGVNITRVFRAGMTLFPYPGLHLQVGDQVYCVGPEAALQRLESILGNKVKKLYHPNILTIFVGLALGILLGSVPIAIPGMPVPLKLGLAGGPLIIAILIGRFGSFMKLVTFTTQSASL
ncbi:MAG: putative transporter, partial [Sutterella sp.]